MIAAGTEFADHQASIFLWDARAGSAPRLQYNEVHSDDVTEVRLFSFFFLPKRYILSDIGQ